MARGKSTGGPTTIQTCRLCEEERPLRRSHIVPDLFRDDSGLRYPTGKSGQPQPFTQPISARPGKRFQRKQHGYWEVRHGMVQPLLCGDCEQQFGTLEDYAKRFFYGYSDPIRLTLPLSPNPLFMADYAKLKLFQLSLLWRASEATGEYFSAVQLSAYHNERLRSMLYNEDPGKDYEYPCVLARLIPSPRVEAANRAHGIAMETGSFAPIGHRFSTWDCYTFVMGAIVWTFSVIHEGGIPEVIRNAYLREWTVLASANGSRQILNPLLYQSSRSR